MKQTLVMSATVVLLAAACGSRDDPSTVAGPPTPLPSAVTAPPCTKDTPPEPSPGTSKETDMSQKPEVQVPDGEPPCELVVQDIVAGSGAEAKAGDTVTVQYVGVAWSDRKEFDTSWGKPQPFSFPLGQGRVIKGWDQGVAGMKEGGRRRLIIPPDLGYGSRGAGGVIQPNETLVFVVDLVKVG